jgi:hypothetical protein
MIRYFLDQLFGKPPLRIEKESDDLPTLLIESYEPTK